MGTQLNILQKFHFRKFWSSSSLLASKLPILSHFLPSSVSDSYEIHKETSDCFTTWCDDNLEEFNVDLFIRTAQFYVWSHKVGLEPLFETFSVSMTYESHQWKVSMTLKF